MGAKRRKRAEGTGKRPKAKAGPRPRTIAVRGNLTLVQTTCKCRRPITVVASETGTGKVTFFDRPLACCPSCRQPFPEVTLEEFIQLIHAGP